MSNCDSTRDEFKRYIRIYYLFIISYIVVTSNLITERLTNLETRRLEETFTIEIIIIISIIAL